jgi:hypothetical protein
VMEGGGWGGRKEGRKAGGTDLQTRRGFEFGFGLVSD